MNGRRRLLSALLASVAIPSILLFSSPALARRGRVRMSGRGLSSGARYSGPTLSQAELRQCVLDERSINAAMDKLERDEVYINQQESQVNQYSQQSVDRFNALVSNFNSEAARANARVDSFNTTCAGRAYYESDMRAVQASFGGK
jgi:outer membrane murein-binding lipoprotein Lpp